MKSSRSSCPACGVITYPAGRVSSRWAASAVRSTRRSAAMVAWTCARAVSGGAGPHIASMICSAPSTVRAFSSR